METTNDKELEMLIKRILHDYLKEQLKDVNKETNNSFVYLEKNTLNRLLNHFLLGAPNRKQQPLLDDVDETQIVNKLQHLITKSKKDFEEILTMINNLS